MSKTLFLVSTLLFAFCLSACQKKSEPPPAQSNAVEVGKIVPKTRGEASSELDAALEKVKVAPNFDNYTKLGLAHTNLRTYRDALDAFEKALALDANSPIAHNNICATHIAMKDWAKARVACNEALKLNPKLEIASNNLKEIDASMDKLKKEIEGLKKALPTMKDGVLTDANLNIGYDYFQLQDYDEALKYWTKVSKKDPRYSFALNNMATVNIIRKKFDLAEKQLNEAEKIDPRNSLVLNNIKWLKDEIEAAKKQQH